MPNYNTIDSFEHWNPNIRSLADRLLIGPQRELLARVRDLNMRYDLNLNITRTYRWSPGYMDQIKKFMVDRYLETHMKRKISTFFNQIDQKTWVFTNISRELRRIDDIMADKRRVRAVFQDNSDLIDDRWEILHEIIVRETNKVRNTMEHIQFDVDIVRGESNGNDSLSFTWAFPQMDMNIFIGNQYYFPVEMGKVEVNILFTIDELVTQLCNDGSCNFSDNENESRIHFRNLTNGSSYGKVGAWYDPKYTGGNERLKHPFISAYTNDLRSIDENGFTSTCLGDLTGRIWSELANMDLLAATLTLQQWLTTFNARDTRPLNNIRQAFWGLPERLNTPTFLNVYPMNAEQCRYPSPEIEHFEDREEAYEAGFDTDYCDTINCGLRDACHYYRFINDIDEPVPAVAIEGEDFEVVDSDADNIHGGEYAQTHTVDRDDVRRDPQGRDIDRFDPEAIVEEVNRINRENGLNDDGTPRDYNEEMDRINGDENPNDNGLGGNMTEEQVLEQLIRQQHRVIDIGRE